MLSTVKSFELLPKHMGYGFDAGQKFVTFFCFQKSANFILFCTISLILLVEPPYFQGRLIMG